VCVNESVYVSFSLSAAWMIQEEEEEEVCVFVLINHQISSLCI
jgi:hypothetical protein